MNFWSIRTLFRWTTVFVGIGISVSMAQMQAFISSEGEFRLILDANKDKFTVSHKNREKQIYK